MPDRTTVQENRADQKRSECQYRGDSGLQCRDHGGGIFLAAISGKSICGRSDRGTARNCGKDVPYQSVVLFPFRTYLFIPEYAAGNWKRTGSNAWWGV